jgi:uncharacterized protein (TIGR03083 family)
MPSAACPIVGAMEQARQDAGGDTEGHTGGHTTAIAMDDERALRALATVTAAMAATVASADPAAPVPGCPGWDLTTLVDHLGRVHLWAEHCARTGQQPDPYPSRDRSLPLAQWYAATAHRLVAGLGALEPSHPSWSFSAEPGHQRAGFWRRRQVHETAVHHVDALQAVGRYPDPSATTPLTGVPGLDLVEVADGVAELLEVMAPRSLVRRRHEPPEQVVPAVVPVAFACTDIDRAWTLRLASGRAQTTAGIAPDAGAVIRGSAAQLYLTLWHRASPSALSLDGDTAAARRILGASLVP